MSDRLEIDSDEIKAHARPAPSRRPIKGVLLFIAVMGLAGGSWWAYRTETPRLPAGAVPVIHPDAAPVKEAPRDPGGMIVPGQDSALLNRDGKSAPKVEQLLPEAEPALPRPVAPAKPAQIETNTTTPKPMPPQTAAAPAPSPPTATAPPPVPSAVTAAPEAAPVAPAPVVTPPPVVNTAAQPAAGPAYRLQLGAVRTEEGAKLEWQRLQRTEPDLLGKLSLTTARVDLGEKGIFYRIQAGPIADAAEAAQRCAALKSRSVGCILVKP